MKKIFLIILFLSFYSLLNANEKSILLKYKVNEDLITNYDILKEVKYLTALNKELLNIEKKRLIEFAEKSLIRESIKKNELQKFYEFDYSSPQADIFIDNFMKKLNIQDRSNFEIYLLDYETSIEEIKKKITIELTWNKFIFDLFEDSI